MSRFYKRRWFLWCVTIGLVIAPFAVVIALVSWKLNNRQWLEYERRVDAEFDGFVLATTTEFLEHQFMSLPRYRIVLTHKDATGEIVLREFHQVFQEDSSMPQFVRQDGRDVTYEVEGSTITITLPSMKVERNRNDNDQSEPAPIEPPPRRELHSV